jgi:hypothetical protein
VLASGAELASALNLHWAGKGLQRFPASALSAIPCNAADAAWLADQNDLSVALEVIVKRQRFGDSEPLHGLSVASILCDEMSEERAGSDKDAFHDLVA